MSRRQAQREFVAVQWLGFCAFTAEGAVSTPDLGTKILQAMWISQKEKKNAYRRLTQNQEQTDPHEELHQASIKISLKKEERRGGGWGGGEGRRGRETEKGRGKEKKSKNRSRVQKAFILKYRITNSC